MTQVIIDSHVFLWAREARSLLSRFAGEILADPAIQKFLSMASVWEMSIKIGTGKLKISNSLEFGRDPIFDRYGVERIW